MDINLNKLVKIYLIWILSLGLIFTSTILFTDEQSLSSGFFNTFESWDGGHFLSISENGYTENYQYAFFPLFPYILKSINNIFLINSVISSLILNLFFVFGFLVILFNLLKSQYNEKIAFKVITLFLVYPFSFFLLLPYSESLFILLAGIFFCLIFKNKLLLASLICGLAIWSRISGIFLLPVLFFSIFSSKPKELIYLLLPIFSLLIYLFWIHSNTNSWLTLFEVEKLYWERNISFPGTSLFQGILHIVEKPNVFSNYINLLAAIFAIGLVIRSLRILSKSYLIYLVSGLGFYMLLSDLTSFPRFLMVLFPVFITLCFIKNRPFIYCYIGLSILFTILNIYFFINGYWVA